MDITYIRGDATNPQGSGPRIITHVVNDRGYRWGRGFVVQLAKRWPGAERAYLRWHREGECAAAGMAGLEGRKQPFALGQIQLVVVGDDIYLANLVGQRDVRRRASDPAPVRYEAIREGLARVRACALDLGASVHLPRIGCGLAGGTWDRVEPIIKEELCAHGVSVTVYDWP